MRYKQNMVLTSFQNQLHQFPTKLKAKEVLLISTAVAAVSFAFSHLLDDFLFFVSNVVVFFQYLFYIKWNINGKKRQIQTQIQLNVSYDRLSYFVGCNQDSQ